MGIAFSASVTSNAKRPQMHSINASYNTMKAHTVRGIVWLLEEDDGTFNIVLINRQRSAVSLT